MNPSDYVKADFHLLALLWLVGCIGGLFLRFSVWGMKQDPDIVTLKFWWHRRKAANIACITLGVLSTWFWAEGSLFRACHLDSLNLALTTGLSPIAGGAVTFFAHYILAAGKRRAEAAAGSTPEED